MRKTAVTIIAIIVVGVGAFFAVKHFNSNKNTTTTSSTTSTSSPPASIAPLTGLSDSDGQAVLRPALTVKIENTPDARPLWGVNYADVVYEEIVNGGITRLAAIFNSHAPEKVGPVRSVRPTDVGIVTPIGGIFAYSGGAQYAINAIEHAPVTLVDETNAGSGMFRDYSRVAPNNLYLIAPKIFAFHGTPVPPPAMFTYRSASDSVYGVAVSSFTVNLPSIYPVTFTWNATTQSWDRSIFGQPDITGSGQRLSPKNVIVQWINYAGGVGTMASVGQFVGTGQAEFFIGGKVTRGTWSRSQMSDVTVYKNTQGQVVKFTPGQTWVVLPSIGETVPIVK